MPTEQNIIAVLTGNAQGRRRDEFTSGLAPLGASAVAIDAALTIWRVTHDHDTQSPRLPSQGGQHNPARMLVAVRWLGQLLCAGECVLQLSTKTMPFSRMVSHAAR